MLLCLQLLLLLHLLSLFSKTTGYRRYVQFVPEIHQKRDALVGHWGVPNTEKP